MNAHIQAQLDLVEAALNTLIDSITSYNPSPPAAVALVAADDGLTEGLEQLSIHQSNYALILALRAETATLDSRIKSTLSQLASTRTELLTSTPVTLPLPTSAKNEIAHTVDYSTLLSYAARIAKFTVPPTYRPPLPPAIEDDIEQSQQSASLAVNGNIPSPAAAAAPITGAEPEAARPFSSLTEAQQAWLDPSSSSVPFTPWPRDDYIRRGALAQIQAARDRGVVDFENTDLTEQPGGDEEARRIEEEQKAREQEEAEKEARRRRESVTMTNGSAAQQRPRRTEEPAREEVFEGFELYNPDEM